MVDFLETGFSSFADRTIPTGKAIPKDLDPFLIDCMNLMRSMDSGIAVRDSRYGDCRALVNEYEQQHGKIYFEHEAYPDAFPDVIGPHRKKIQSITDFITVSPAFLQKRVEATPPTKADKQMYIEEEDYPVLPAVPWYKRLPWWLLPVGGVIVVGGVVYYVKRVRKP